MSEETKVRCLRCMNSGRWLVMCASVVLVFGEALLGFGRSGHVLPEVPIVSDPCTIRTPGNYRLVKDLHYEGLSGSAVIIKADNVIIDFAGHKLWSDAKPITKSVGVAATGQSCILIRNGTVAGFQFGIQLSGTAQQSNQIQCMLCAGNTYIGLWAEGKGTVVINNRIVDTGGCNLKGFTIPIGIHVAGSNSRIVNNSIRGMSWCPGVTREIVALALDDVANTRVANNELVQPKRSENSWGIWVNSVGNDFSSTVKVEHNRIANFHVGASFVYAKGRLIDNQFENVATPLLFAPL